ncbi:MAG: type II secretion system protein [Gemmatimonadales bacterium]|jgi:prepilin-type N-terminal cleavage/methylation domain-containing protein
MKGNRGFSIVELIVSMTIFSFGVLGGVALLETGFRWEGRAELTTQLTVAAEMKVEELKALAGTDLADTVQIELGGSLETDVANHFDRFELDGRTYKRRWSVEDGPSGTRRVTVRSEIMVGRVVGQADLWTYVIHD